MNEGERLCRDSLAVLHEGLQEVHERQVAYSNRKRYIIGRHRRNARFITEFRDVVHNRADNLHDLHSP